MNLEHTNTEVKNTDHDTRRLKEDPLQEGRSPEHGKRALLDVYVNGS